jgi:hypothetical protein
MQVRRTAALRKTAKTQVRHSGAGYKWGFLHEFAKGKYQYKWMWQNPNWQVGFRPLMQEFWNERPDGVPHTWTTIDIDTDIGTFSEDTFPPGLPGETLEEYCRRVPNCWSPCSKSTDTVETEIMLCPEFAADWLIEDHKFTERPMVKITPADSDYRLEQEWLDLEETGIRQPPLVNGKPLYPVFTKEEVQKVIVLLEECFLKTGSGYWYKSRNWPDFWHEITGLDHVPEGELYEKLRAVFYPEPNSFQLPNELRHPDELLTQPTGRIQPPNRWAEKQEEILKTDEDFKYMLDRDFWRQENTRMEKKIENSESWGETNIRVPYGISPKLHPDEMVYNQPKESLKE